ncbi:hypothetical protein TNCV_2587131 [Trichonephila clavipes]|nr:hypothetical protein TNCV_2587131 [Trichonephila clavipes]
MIRTTNLSKPQNRSQVENVSKFIEWSRGKLSPLNYLEILTSPYITDPPFRFGTIPNGNTSRPETKQTSSVHLDAQVQQIICATGSGSGQEG